MASDGLNLTFSPFNLPHAVSGEDADLGVQLLEAHTPKQFCKDVSLLAGVDMINLHLPCFNLVSEEMVSDLYVLASVMEHRVFAPSNCRLIVHSESPSCLLLSK